MIITVSSNSSLVEGEVVGRDKVRCPTIHDLMRCFSGLELAHEGSVPLGGVHALIQRCIREVLACFCFILEGLVEGRICLADGKSSVLSLVFIEVGSIFASW